MTMLPDEPPDRRISVAVLGSCMTRDNFNHRFNPDYATRYRVTLTQSQASLVSLMSRPTPVPAGELAHLRPYDLRRARADLTKSFLGDLAAGPPDCLVVDFSGDIRFGAVRFEEDRWVTGYRRVLAAMSEYRALVAGGAVRDLRVERDGEAYLAHWVAATDRFAAHVRRVAPRTTVVLHRGHHARWLRLAGAGRTVPLVDHRRVVRLDLDRIDALWARMDDHAIRAYGWRAIDLRGRVYPTSDAHPWGAGYLHYSPDYYADFLAALDALCREPTADPAAPRWRAGGDVPATGVAEPVPERSWELEPGRGTLEPRIRRPRRFGRIRRAARRARRRLGRSLRATWRQPLDPAA